MTISLRLRLRTALPALALVAVALPLPGCANNIDDLVMCETDDDCPGGYCHDTDLFCVSGERECLVDTDCNPPTTICANGQCAQGCTLGGCELGETCNPATGRCRFLESCTIDSQCAPPELVCSGGYCEPGCSITGCPDGFCDPYSGHCQGSTACTGDGDCSPPASICEGQQCVPGCVIEPCTGSDQCNQITGHCVPVGGCMGDADCSPPSTICEGTSCVPGCGSTGCTGGLECNTATGRCESSTALLDGEACTANSQCVSGFCMDIIVATIPYQVCSRPCCVETDCAVGSACLYHRGTKLCVPDSIYPAGYSFTQSAGQACGASGPYCRSGFCNYQTGLCARTCCESSQCGVDECVWYFDEASDYMFELCADYTGLPNAPTGTGCTNWDQCTSFVCLNNNQCADLCCTNADCPGGTLCAQVLGQSGNAVATTVCVAGSPGAGADGAACTVGDAPSPYCQSGLCANGICRSPCCDDSDCPGAATCQPVASGFDLNNDGTSDWVRACMP